MIYEKKNLFITKYALTKGIQKVECDIRDRNDGFATPAGALCDYFYIGVDAFLEESDAIKKAEKMRTSAIRSTEKRLHHLQGLKFGPSLI